jgi:hypothetical protein
MYKRVICIKQHTKHEIASLNNTTCKLILNSAILFTKTMNSLISKCMRGAHQCISFNTSHTNNQN